MILTDDLREQILAAGAAHFQLSAADYTGLRPGMTYVARDSSGTLWAGTSLVPSKDSYPAQVASQDDGSYLLMRRSADGTWKVWSVGGAAPAYCAAIPLPRQVVDLWGWDPTRCRPDGTY